MTGTWFGSRVRRIEDPPLVTGRGRYVDDIHLPDMVHAAFLRSPHAHARLIGIDTATAKAMPGVHAVLTIADLAPHLTEERLPLGFRTRALPDGITPYVLAKDEVVYVGEPVALVIADSRYRAEDAAAAIAVDYEPLPAVPDCRAAVAPGAPRARLAMKSNVLTEFNQEYGDVAGAFAKAAHVFAVKLNQHRGVAHPIEGRGVVARYEAADDRLTLWDSTQQSHEIRSFLGELLNLDENRIRVVAPDVGGGFGCKFILYAEEAALATATRMIGRPIKWIEDRREHFLAAIQERDQVWEMEVAADPDGRLLGARGRMIHDQGAYTPQGINLPYNASTVVPSVYVLPAYRLHVQVVETNRVPVAPVRGAGYPEGCFAMERMLDAVADGLGLDRIEVRRRNLVPAERMPYRTPLLTRAKTPVEYDSGDFPLCQNKALDGIDFASFRARQESARKAGRYIGLGLAHGIKGTGRGPYESGTVRIGRSGKVSVYTGALAMGQGLKTILAQITADQLGVAVDDIEVVAGDTATIPLGLGGFASRQTVTAGSSVHIAAGEVRAKVLKVAANLLEAAESDLELRDGEVRVKGVADMSVSLRDVALVATGMPGYSIPKGVEAGLESNQNFAPESLAYSNGCHAVELEVDVETGQVHFVNYVLVSDSGRLVNPMTADGQLHGGAAHGIGNALFEWMGYDQGAQPLTTTLAEYLMPTAPEIPRFTVIHHESPSPLNPLGVKGIGECGTLPAAAAIVSAIEDALRPFGVRLGEYPVRPHRLLELIRRGTNPQ
ncbi:MAG: xanthine dehydrogenase family protein molybdopterin-binding subunit [Alphaproteobacteria bacterium]|nr:xanthine dehydrogenase family protein molybdopterin-binding subunit [Alphaproteobacteria bacterium]